MDLKTGIPELITEVQFLFIALVFPIVSNYENMIFLGKNFFKNLNIKALFSLTKYRIYES